MKYRFGVPKGSVPGPVQFPIFYSFKAKKVQALIFYTVQGKAKKVVFYVN